MTAIAVVTERFDHLGVTWWDSLRPVSRPHVVNALLLNYVVEEISSHLCRDTANGLRMLGLGCGGGLLSEALARSGVQVVGVDASPGNVAAARLHAASQGVTVDYRLGEPDEVQLPQEHFDVVLAFEVVEHVSDVPVFLATASAYLAPGGMLFVSTIDRSFQRFVVANLGAEYLLRVLPSRTHKWSMFVRPDELGSSLSPSGLKRRDLCYVPLVHQASWCRNTKVNYIATYTQGAS